MSDYWKDEYVNMSEKYHGKLKEAIELDTKLKNIVEELKYTSMAADVEAQWADEFNAKLGKAMQFIKSLRRFVRVDVRHGYISKELADSKVKEIDEMLEELAK